jgi:hypothetical protein
MGEQGTVRDRRSDDEVERVVVLGLRRPHAHIASVLYE